MSRLASVTPGHRTMADGLGPLMQDDAERFLPGLRLGVGRVVLDQHSKKMPEPRDRLFSSILAL